MTIRATMPTSITQLFPSRRDGREFLIDLFIAGIAKPGGSKTASVVRRKGGAIVMHNGRPLITVRDASKNQDWKRTIAFTVRQSYRGVPQDCPLAVETIFVMQRPKAHFRTGKHAGQLRDDAPFFHDKAPDATKIFRCLEDSLIAILWKDDRIIADQRIRKVYGDCPGAYLRLRRLGPNDAFSLPQI